MHCKIDLRKYAYSQQTVNEWHRLTVERQLYREYDALYSIVRQLYKYAIDRSGMQKMIIDKLVGCQSRCHP